MPEYVVERARLAVQRQPRVPQVERDHGSIDGYLAWDVDSALRAALAQTLLD